MKLRNSLVMSLMNANITDADRIQQNVLGYGSMPRVGWENWFAYKSDYLT
jgi:hypothetical protein